MLDTLTTFDKRAEAVMKNHLAEGEAKLSSADIRDAIMTDFKTAAQQMNALRSGTRDRRAVDISLAQFVQEKWGFAPAANGSPDASFYAAIGVNPSQATIASLASMGDIPDGYRWLVPEVIREAIRLGLRRSPIYTNLIAAEETVSQPTVIMPQINLSNGMPTKLGEGETISTGEVAFGQKTVKLQKVGTGIKISDEVVQYVSLNLLSLYLQDVGVNMNLALDSLAIETLINGDQSDGSEAAPVIGTQTVSVFAYIDFLRAVARMHRLGRTPESFLSDEEVFLEIYQLPEFKGRQAFQSDVTLQVRTPIPTTMAYDIHGAMPDTNKVMIIDSNGALIKLNSAALKVESERIVERQISGTYVTMTTGYASLFRDARLIIDKSVTFASQGFPSWMNPSAVEAKVFGGN